MQWLGMMLAMPAVAVVVGASAAAPARAPDETEQMLIRAHKGLTPTFRDRDLAREYLEEWEDTGPDDPALRRAFRMIAEGVPPPRGQLPELVRLHENYRQTRAEALRRARRPDGARGTQEAHSDAAVGWSLGLRSCAKLAFVAGAVFAGGVGWVLIARRRKSA